MARRPVRVALTALFVGSPHVGHAQTLRDIAAWDALVVSPIGALPPRMHDELFVGTRTPAELSVRYGRWRYDEDDAIHNDIGLTVTHGFGATRTDIAVTDIGSVVHVFRQDGTGGLQVPEDYADAGWLALVAADTCI